MRFLLRIVGPLCLITACDKANPAPLEHPQTQVSQASASSTPSSATTPASPQGAPASNIKSVTAVLPVKDHAVAVAWYARWIGHDADVVPAEGMAEWNLAGKGWLQVALDPDHAGHTSVAIVVHDLAQQRDKILKAGVKAGELQDYGVVKLFEIVDPAGNKVLFVQETGQAAP